MSRGTLDRRARIGGGAAEETDDRAVGGHGHGSALPEASGRHGGRARAFARVTGELLLTLGLLVLLFLAWQLWWTDIESTRAQDAAVNSLEDNFQEHAPAAVQPRGTRAPSATKLVSAQTATGSKFAVMYIPRFGADFRRPVVQGTEAPELSMGIGHVPSSVMPGQIGNFATAGHRVTYGKPYNQIETLKKGDFLVVETSDGWSIYRYHRSRIVAPDEVAVIAPVPDAPGKRPTEAWMTMVACHPKFSAAQRYIGYAKLERFVPRTARGVPAKVQRALQVPSGVS